MQLQAFEASSLWPEVEEIIYNKRKPTRKKISVMVHTEKEGFPVYNILSIDTVSDYANAIGDDIEIKFRMLFGDYVLRLFPYRNNLELTVKREILIEGTNKPDPDYPIQTIRYKAMFSMDENIVVDVSQFKLIDHESLNKMDIVTVKLQLIDRWLEPFRVKMITSSVFQNKTQKQLLHSITGAESSLIQVDGQPALQGLDIVEPDNTEVRTQIMFPDGKRVVDLPTYLQEKSNGVYNAGIGCYFAYWKELRYWFIYPLYKVSRFDEDTDKAIFYNVPEERFQGVNRTYKKEGKTLKVACTGAKKYAEATDQYSLNEGVGFRMAAANAYMKKPIEIKEEGPVGKRTNLNFEVGMAYREDNLNFASWTQQRISSNPFVEYSRFVHRQSARVDVVWEQSDPTLLYPGMPCKYIFLEKNQIKELKGTILFVQTLEGPISKTPNENIFETISHVTMATETYKEKPEPPKILPPGEF